jgi:hypothetical protein
MNIRATNHPVLRLPHNNLAGLELKHDKGGVSVGASPGTGVPGSRAPTYATHDGPKPNTKLQ